MLRASIGEWSAQLVHRFRDPYVSAVPACPVRQSSCAAFSGITMPCSRNTSLCRSCAVHGAAYVVCQVPHCFSIFDLTAAVRQPPIASVSRQTPRHVSSSGLDIAVFLPLWPAAHRRLSAGRSAGLFTFAARFSYLQADRPSFRDAPATPKAPGRLSAYRDGYK